MKSRFQIRKRLLSFIMVFAMVISLMPQTSLVVQAADHTGGTIYFQKPDGWTGGSDVYFLLGHSGWSAAYTMNQVPGTNWYTCAAPNGEWSDATYFAVYTADSLFGGGAWNWDNNVINNELCYHCTGTYEIQEGFANGNNYYLVPASADRGAGFSFTKSSQDLLNYDVTSVTAAGEGGGNWLNGAEWVLDEASNHMAETEEGSNVWQITYNDVAAGDYKLKFIANDNTDWSTNINWGGTFSRSGEKTSAYLSGGDIEFTVPFETANVTVELDLTGGAMAAYYTITIEDASPVVVERDVNLHFMDNLNWGTVYGYACYASTRQELMGAFPGTKLEKDSNGYYTMGLELNSIAEDLIYIFSNGSGTQTVDLVIDKQTLADNETIDRWIQVDGLTDGKYNCTVSSEPTALLVSPEVGDGTVTFRYKGDATSVAVAGTFNGWSSSANAMTKNSSGVWETTIQLDPGSYQYKFVIDGNWKNDPLNYATIGSDGNSFVVVPGAIEAPTENEIKLEVTYSRDDENYDRWNAYCWGSSTPGSQGDFVINETTNECVTTFSYPDARSNTSITVAVRKGEWDEKACEQSIDISDVLSGTIYAYVSTKNGQNHFSYVFGSDVVRGNKVLSANVDYDNNQFIVKTKQAGNIALYKEGVDVSDTVTITSKGTTHTIQLDSINLKELYQYTVRIADDTFNQDYKIFIYNAYASEKFEREYTYTGNDLGAMWSESATTFKVWAPTATAVKVARYSSGTADTNDLIEEVTMTPAENGVWVATVNGDISSTYYTYKVTVDGETIEACDPYARTTGVNSKRAMVLDLDATNPDDWEYDKNPHEGMNYTDAIIYELHVRDFSIDESSGIKDEYQGKYLGLTETGTTLNGVEGATSTGLDYLKELGITHLHLLPVYDYGSVDEADAHTRYQNSLDNDPNNDEEVAAQFNWGYDPVNYNVPEGSYSTDPYKGEVRVEEFKEMVQTLHESDINVVMDVVYNHVYDGAKFCINQIVPGYFSRFKEDGTYYSATGCGNDTASERSMVRKYIVDSVVYWAEEYHIDGFRFDLVGILDAETVKAIVTAAHKVDEDILFYGEGWDMAGYTGLTMATQANYESTPGFGYFSDSMRSLLTGNNDATEKGFPTGAQGNEGWLTSRFKGSTDASNGTPIPTQVVNYASCHDNYALWDKIILTTPDATEADRIKMNNLAAAIYMTSQGIPFIHAGEEMLRSKPLGDGKYEHNSYKSSDALNSIKWDRIVSYETVSEYYEGLIEFRKNHAALRMTDESQINGDGVITTWYGEEDDGKIMYIFDGSKIDGEVADKIVVIFNNNNYSVQDMNLPDGEWTICVNDTHAGIESLGTATGSVTVPAISAMILVQGETEDKNSIYNEITRDEKLEGYTISLDGNIGINFYMSLSAEAKEDTGAYMQFTLPNGDTSKVSIADAVEKNGSYVFSCEVAAKEMTKDVTAQMVFSDGTKGEVYTYSVKDYADAILADNTQTEKVKTLVTNMLHYGANAQTYFKYNTAELANAGLTAQDLSGITIDSFEAYEMHSYPLVSGLTYVGASLILESETTLRVWFTVENSVDSYDVTCEDKTLTLEKNGDYYCVDITDISAQKLNDMYTICVSGESVDEPADGSLEIAALTYCHNVLKNDTTDEDLLNVIKSIYLYNQAADDYLNKN